MTDLWAGIDCDWRAGGSKAPSATALDLAGRLVEATRAAGFPPHSARHGYWPTVCLIWDDGRVEVEVFDGRYELYFLPGGEAGRQFTVAEYAAETPGILVPEIRKAREGRTDGR